MAELTKKFALALSPELKKEIEESAKKNDRTLTGEITRAIKFYLKHANTDDTYVTEKQEVKEEIAVTVEPPKKVEMEEEKPMGINAGRFGRI